MHDLHRFHHFHNLSVVHQKLLIDPSRWPTVLFRNLKVNQGQKSDKYCSLFWMPRRRVGMMNAKSIWSGWSRWWSLFTPTHFHSIITGTIWNMAPSGAPVSKAHFSSITSKVCFWMIHNLVAKESLFLSSALHPDPSRLLRSHPPYSTGCDILEKF